MGGSDTRDWISLQTRDDNKDEAFDKSVEFDFSRT